MATTTAVNVNSVNVIPPNQFSFIPEEWKRWLQRWNRYRTASALNKKSETEQVNMFIYTMGEKAEDILLGFALTEAESTVYETVHQKFDDHFVGKKNVIFERARFNQRAQREGESIEDFISDIYQLAESCEYGLLKNELLRDRIIVGIRNDKLSRTLQLDPDLTLETTVTKVRQAEKVLKQQKVVRAEQSNIEDPIDIDAVRQKKFYNKNTLRTGNREASSSNSSNNSSRQCSRCGSTAEDIGQICVVRNL